MQSDEHRIPSIDTPDGPKNYANVVRRHTIQAALLANQIDDAARHASECAKEEERATARRVEADREASLLLQSYYQIRDILRELGALDAIPPSALLGPITIPDSTGAQRSGTPAFRGDASSMEKGPNPGNQAPRLHHPTTPARELRGYSPTAPVGSGSKAHPYAFSPTPSPAINKSISKRAQEDIAASTRATSRRRTASSTLDGKSDSVSPDELPTLDDKLDVGTTLGQDGLLNSGVSGHSESSSLSVEGNSGDAGTPIQLGDEFSDITMNGSDRMLAHLARSDSDIHGHLCRSESCCRSVRDPGPLSEKDI